MPSISFTFSAESSGDERAAALREIEQWQGIKAAGFINPKSKNPVIQTMAMAVLEDPEFTGDVIARLRSLPVVVQADIPAKRGL